MGNDNQLELQDLFGQLGEFGRYQLKQHILHNLAWLLFAIHMMSFVFVFPVVGHRCYVKEVDAFHYENINISKDLQMYIPRGKDSKFESCLRYDNILGGVHSCDDGYVYNYTTFPSSRVADWDMVCDKSWMRAMLQSSFLFGTLIGSLVSGFLADKFGRKPVFCVGGVLQLFCGLACAFLDNYYALAVSMFWYGVFGGSGPVVTSVALTMELVGASKRNVCGVMFTAWFGLGGIIVAILAYLIHVPAKILQIIFAMHALLLCGHFWFMDESICWLWTSGRKEKAIEIVKKAVKQNGQEFKLPPQKTIYSISLSLDNLQKGKDSNGNTTNSVENLIDEPSKPGNFDLFRYSKLRSRSLVMMYCWFASNLGYFGLSFNSVNLAGNPHFMFITSILSEIPGHVISFVLTAKLGNKMMLFLSLFLTGSANVLVPFMPVGNIQVYLTMMAKTTATVTINLINSYTAELFPTSLRNMGIGLCMMAARTGAALIPQINLLSSVAHELPTIIFGTVGVTAGLLTLLVLPETMNRPIPQTVEDVENSKDEKTACVCTVRP